MTFRKLSRVMQNYSLCTLLNLVISFDMGMDDFALDGEVSVRKQAIIVTPP